MMTKFGLELVLAIAAKTPWNQPSDAVLLLVHWLLASDQNLGCVGIGDSFGDDDTKPSELLPSDWNKKNRDENGAHYILKYRNNITKQKYVLKMVHSVGGTWQVILYRVGDDKQSNITVDVNSEVTDIEGYPFKNVDQV